MSALLILIFWPLLKKRFSSSAVIHFATLNITYVMFSFFVFFYHFHNISFGFLCRLKKKDSETDGKYVGQIKLPMVVWAWFQLL